MRKYIDIAESAIFELFDPSVQLEPYARDEDGVEGYTFHADGREYFVGFADEGDDEYYMSFTGEDDRGRQSAHLLGHNRPFRVFSGVMSAILAFIEAHEPDMIFWDIDSSENQRVRTYDRMLYAAERNGSMPEGYAWDRDANDRYKIIRDG